MQFPHTGPLCPLIQLLEVTIHIKWDFFCGGGHKLVPYLEYRFTFFQKKKIKQTADGLRRGLPKVLFLNHSPLPAWFRTSGSYFLNSQMGIFHLHFY